MTTLAARIAHDHQPTAHGCTCGKHLVAPKCARGTLTPFIAHVVEVTDVAVREESAREIAATLLDPDRIRPRTGSGYAGDFLNDWQWAVSILRNPT